MNNSLSVPFLKEGALSFFKFFLRGILFFWLSFNLFYIYQPDSIQEPLINSNTPPEIRHLTSILLATFS